MLFIGTELGNFPDTEVVQQLNLPVAEEVPEGGTPAQDEVVLPPPNTTQSGEGPSAKHATNKPFILSEGLPPVPFKLTEKILRGEFVDMAELLRDNLEVQRRASTATQSASLPAPRCRREIPDLLSWVQCFGTYMAIVVSKYPHRMRELLAYQTLIVREARRCGGRGWLAYDSFFRQQAVGDDAADWSRLNQSLYAVTFVTQGNRERGRSCMLCLESDHGEEQCALYTPPPRAIGDPARRAASDRPAADQREWQPTGREEWQPTGRGKGPSRMACYSWNQGTCRFPGCKYRHICIRCSGDHRFPRCPWFRSEREMKPRDSKPDERR